MKKIIIGCGLVLLCAIIVFVAFMIWFHSAVNDHLSKKEIFSLVHENHCIILEDIKKNNFDCTYQLNGIKDISVLENCVDFSCGGSGFGPSTSYYGFYYSGNNAVDAMRDREYPKNAQLVPDGDGYSYREPGGDNRYYVEKIRDGFYYYESHY